MSIVAVRGETAAGQTDIVSPVATLPLLALHSSGTVCTVHCITLPLLSIRNCCIAHYLL